MAFMKQWNNRVPVIIVPTKYPTEPIDKFVQAGVTNFIFANHSLRTVVTALQRNLRILHDTRDLMSIEREIAPVSEVFRLQDVQELKSSEERYLPHGGARQEVSGVVLAASKGDFGELVKDRPEGDAAPARQADHDLAHRCLPAPGHPPHRRGARLLQGRDRPRRHPVFRQRRVRHDRRARVAVRGARVPDRRRRDRVRRHRLRRVHPAQPAFAGRRHQHRRRRRLEAARRAATPSATWSRPRARTIRSGSRPASSRASPRSSRKTRTASGSACCICAPKRPRSWSSCSITWRRKSPRRCARATSPACSTG